MEEQNKHFSHTHNLTIHQMPQGTQITCSGCKSPGTGIVYACWQCNFLLHEQCFHATRSLHHLSHPSHPLTLLPFPTYPTNCFSCNSCNQVGTGFSYSCSACEFDLHVQCAYSISLSSHLTPETHVFPHQNPPLPIQVQAPIFNPQTANIPLETPIDQRNPSPLSQQTLPRYNPQYASIPHQDPTNQPTPSTPIANYPPISAPQDSHLPQPISSNHIQNYPPINETLLYLSAPQNSHSLHEPIYPNVPTQTSLPKTEPFPSLNSTNGVYNTESPSSTDQGKTQGIMHFSHPHALHEVILNAEEDSTKCSACEEVISGSRYSCSESSCDFHLDKSCFELAREIQHKSHPEHPLTLLSCPYAECAGQFGCSGCNKDGGGFTYHCATCQFDLHIKCSSLPETVERDDHKHPIKLIYSSPAKGRQEYVFVCDVCREIVQEDGWTYYCEICEHGTHVACVNCEVKPVEESQNEETQSVFSTGDPVLDAQLQMQRLQIQMQLANQNAQFQLGVARQNAQMVMGMGQRFYGNTSHIRDSI